jgi:hypothetical protein
MIRTVLIVLLFLFPKVAFSAEWYQVKGGFSHINLNQVKVEAALWEFVKANYTRTFEPANSYTFQYQLTNSDTVKINAMCQVDNVKELSKYFVFVDDGGSCYFELTYNIKSHKFANLYVNGFA